MAINYYKILRKVNLGLILVRIPMLVWKKKYVIGAFFLPKSCGFIQCLIWKFRYKSICLLVCLQTYSGLSTLIMTMILFRYQSHSYEMLKSRSVWMFSRPRLFFLPYCELPRDLLLGATWSIAIYKVGAHRLYIKLFWLLATANSRSFRHHPKVWQFLWKAHRTHWKMLCS